MAKSLVTCFHCGKEHLKENGAINRSKKNNDPMFCSRPCLTAWRKDHVFTGGVRKTTVFRTEEQKRQDKRDYDKVYREKNKERIKLRKQAYSKTEAGRAAQKRSRKKRVKKHNEYCKQPKYREYKHKYDVVRGMVQEYGEYWECAVLVNAIEKEILKWIPTNERHYYLNNVRNQTLRNNRRRLEKVLSDIENGDAGEEVLRFNWTKSSKALIREVLVAKRI